MATPATDVKSSDFNTEILRASGSTQVSMSAVRTRYGGSGQISFGDLRKAEGFIITCGYYYAGGKPEVELRGYDRTLSTTGSVTPQESGEYLILGPTSTLVSIISFGANTSTDTTISISTTSAGYTGTDITRVVTANTSRSIVTSSTESCNFTYSMPSSGNLHCLVKF